MAISGVQSIPSNQYRPALLGVKFSQICVVQQQFYARGYDFPRLVHLCSFWFFCRGLSKPANQVGAFFSLSFVPVPGQSAALSLLAFKQAQTGCMRIPRLRTLNPRRIARNGAGRTPRESGILWVCTKSQVSKPRITRAMLTDDEQTIDCVILFR